jgi:serine/threonine-protein phosphatase 2B regulatory subunit
LAKRFIQLLDTDQDGRVDFTEFLNGLATFATTSTSASKEDDRKLLFIFNMYDVNQDGFLSNGDLFNALKLMVGENLDDVSLQVSIKLIKLFMF